MAKLLGTPSQLSATFDKLLRTHDTIHFAVAWASTGFKQYSSLVDASHKIGRGVVGTHFYQTGPDFIEKFAKNKRVRFVKSPSGVFHPKLFVFENNRGEWACIVGSSNFTAGGFAKNSELSVLVTEADDPDGAILRQAKGSINQYWAQAIPGRLIDLANYREMQKRFAKPLDHAAGRFGKGKPGLAYEDIAILNLNWDEFFSQVKEEQKHHLSKRASVLDAARALFTNYGSFEEMPINDRKGIAGFSKDKTIPWGWFGSMTGAGRFKSIVNNRPGMFSRALDQIPLTGQVTKEQYLKFIRYYVRAYEGSSGHGFGTATRLLAMRRPDYFVCLDSANRTGLMKAFKIQLKSGDYEDYWDKIIERLILAKWWMSPRPTEKQEQKVWDGRAAMLDAIYYDP